MQPSVAPASVIRSQSPFSSNLQQGTTVATPPPHTHICTHTQHLFQTLLLAFFLLSGFLQPSSPSSSAACPEVWGSPQAESAHSAVSPMPAACLPRRSHYAQGLNPVLSPELTTLASKSLLGRAPVAHACNPNDSGSRDQEDHGSRSAWKNSL
jgi:hypothetical protein